MRLNNAVQLIVYPDRIGADLTDLARFLDGPVGAAIGGLHLLPPFPSNADGGFSPLTHREIDPAVGTWGDVEALAARFDLCLDLVLNHLSDHSPEFRDFVRHGAASKHAPLFIDVDTMDEITPDDLAKIHIRKEKEPFRAVVLADGREKRVWCTFSAHQIDLDYRSPETFALMEENLREMTAHGVKLFRLDAFGYTTKQIGTSCFLVEPQVWHILDWFRDTAARYHAEVLPEVHDHPSWQYAISARGMWSYAFALPPLVLYALLDANSVYLKAWLRMCPHRQVTVLDTHDGICIPDVEDILPKAAIEGLLENVSARSADPIMRGSAANVHSVGAIYQLTCTFYDALKRDDDAYIAARAIQFFAPGIPQVYYVGLLAGQNDTALMEATGELRDINRHRYSLAEAEAALKQPVVERLLALMQLRSTHPAFGGEFVLEYSNETSVAMGWRAGDQVCKALIDLRFRTTTITCTDPAGGERTWRA
ncbi:sucrose phosphorylase [Denitromonas iodatirespirans]|uniref:Sucrose phosphorylase n=1 Tax=Denitromonas iodatirespirans TaxID=2795389 RepID=A0A944DDE8_DENI1|nr:sucrose phosphorylase [Denitromonas iodatirespirans]MBT0962297.1 sucrose phosphorylase [Denitromonas iodatirespirans]